MNTHFRWFYPTQNSLKGALSRLIFFHCSLPIIDDRLIIALQQDLSTLPSKQKISIILVNNGVRKKRKQQHQLIAEKMIASVVGIKMKIASYSHSCEKSEKFIPHSSNRLQSVINEDTTKSVIYSLSPLT